MASPRTSPVRFSREERVGLVVATAAHAALFAWLTVEPLGKPVLAPPERMTVRLADEVAPEPVSPDMTAGESGTEVREPQPLFEPIPPLEPAGEPVEAAVQPPAPVTRPSASPSAPPPKPAVTRPRPSPRPSAAPAKAPAVKASPKAKPSPSAKAASAKAGTAARTSAKSSAKPAAKAETKAGDERSRRRPDAPSGSSRIGSDFLKGVPGDQARGAGASAPAAKAGPQVAAALSQAIARQLKPRWTAPQGVEADRLVTVLAWQLNPDGSLAGRPRVVSQSGVTDANRAQQARHAEQAIRAVQLAAPFKLPAEHYQSWKRVSSFRFDRKLSQ